MPFACICATGISSCHRATITQPDISVTQQITPQPVKAGPATVALKLADAQSEPVTHATIQVEADMSHPGMAPVFSEAKETTPGSYQAQFNLTMAGDWVVLLHIQLANGQKLERRIDVKNVRPN